jgi:uncharacterized protein
VTLIFDNNVILSAAFNSTSVSYKALKKGLSSYRVIRSENTFKELTTTIYKAKFDKYFLSMIQREQFLHYYLGRTILQSVNHTVELCRDPKDDIYLELALSGKADLIISGDKDLLVLNPFQGIPIITPSQFLENS